MNERPTSGMAAHGGALCCASELDARLRDELARQREPRLGWMRVQLAPADRDRAAQLIAASLRGGDLVGLMEPACIEVFLAGAAPEAVDAVASRVVALLRRNAVPHEMGWAAFGRDGRSLHELRKMTVERLRRSRSLPSPDDLVVVEGSRLADVYALAVKVACSDVPVLIVGETGSGKELIAEAVHRSSARGSAPLLRLNCASLSDSLLESELFGHRKGAFTGAVANKAGLFDAASGGTVFLDEVVELPLSTQAKLLRVIERQRVLPVGATDEHAVNVRFIAACNQPLEQAVAQGRFRQDLYYRLNGFTLHVPPLRERRDEIPILARHFVACFSREAEAGANLAIAPEVMQLFETYAWPGNVRELRHVVQRAVLLAGRGPITLEHVALAPAGLTCGRTPSTARRADSPPAAVGLATPSSCGPWAPLADVVDVAQRNGSEQRRRDEIIRALQACGGNQTRAAAQLGISRRTLCNWLDRYHIPRPRRR